MSSSILVDSLYVYMGKKAALWDLTFEIPKGIMVGILGPNGAGKSTLFKTALGIVPAASGKIEILGKPIHEAKTKVSYIPQRESIDWDFPITLKEVVLMGRYRKMGLFGRIRQADCHAALHALEKLGLLDHAEEQISNLSGGQQQKLMIARALLEEDAEILFLDEPFSGIDVTTEKMIIDLLKEQKRKGKTIFIIHHDFNTVENYFDWTLLLNTRLISSGPVKTAFSKDLISKAFGNHQPLFDEAKNSFVKTLTGAS